MRMLQIRVLLLAQMYYCDDHRHLVCKPYSVENLHKMADELQIKRCWFHRNHYDIPKRRIDEIKSKCIVVNSKEIVKIINADIA
jgi:hypothetical protein